MKLFGNMKIENNSELEIGGCNVMDLVEEDGRGCTLNSS